MNQDRKNEILVTKDEIAQANSTFWNEMCGSIAFRNLGLKEISTDSLLSFDNWYFDFYPYLMPWLKGFVEPSSRVLEVGLGFGSVGQFLADNSSSYVGIDIAEGPVNLMKYRLVESPQKFTAICTDVLDMPLADASQDVVVAIGSLHHVGDFESAVKEIARVLGPNGRLAGMVYASFSLRSIFRDPKRTALALVGGWKKQARFSDSPRLRSAADVNSTGDPAPFTEFFSKASLRAALASDFEQVAIVRRNASSLPFVGQGLRRATLSKPFQWFFSLDLYFTATVKNP